MEGFEGNRRYSRVDVHCSAGGDRRFLPADVGFAKQDRASQIVALDTVHIRYEYFSHADQREILDDLVVDRTRADH